MLIIHKDQPIQITAEPGVAVYEALNSSMFKDWLEHVDTDHFKIESVHFQSHDAITIKDKKRNLFVKFNAKMFANGKLVPAITLASDSAVAALVVLKCGKKKYGAIVRQPRTATGEVAFAEIPAGMMDGKGNVVNQMLDELVQELGLQLTADMLHPLNDPVLQPRGLFVSPGRCTETIRLFYAEQDVDKAALKSFRDRRTGLAEENEYIRTDVVELSQLYDFPDFKTSNAVGLYERMLRRRRSHKACAAA